jgi:two-component system, NarL family, sensor histidine kinase UhpB
MPALIDGAVPRPPAPVALEVGAVSGEPVRPHGSATGIIRVLGLVLRAPLLLKILVANGLIIGAGAGALVIGLRPLAGSAARVMDASLLWALAVVVVITALNATLVALAVRPIRSLTRLAARVQEGDLTARAPLSALADPDIAGLTRLVNGLLDGLVEYRDRLRQMGARALNAEEEERKRIARELHDDTAQRLAALLIRLRLTSDPADPAQMTAFLTGLRGELVATLDGIRHYARALRPPALDELGLVRAIEARACTLCEATGMSIKVNAGSTLGALTPQAELALYRIVQEALSNAVRHSGAQLIRVDLGDDGAAVTATVQDDGCGFDVERTLTGDAAGLGLHGMRERAAYVGGAVTVTSLRESGTRVLARIPHDGETSAVVAGGSGAH